MIIQCPACTAKMMVPDNILADLATQVKCPACKKVFKPAAATAGQQPSVKKVFGWLVVHDENTPSQTFELSKETMLVGRYDPNTPCDVMIKTNDRAMSRNHFSIEIVNRKNEHLYILKDHRSAGGTHVETKRLETFSKEMRRLHTEEEVYISDGAIILAGKTKIFFKSSNSVKTEREATMIISKQAYTKTVIL